MRTNAESRLIALEIATANLRDQVRRLADSLAALQAQSRIGPAAVYSGGGGAAGGGVFVAIGGVPGASAAPPGGTPGGATMAIYQIVNGIYVPVSIGATVYNPMLNGVQNPKITVVHANSDGTYTLSSESCT